MLEVESVVKIMQYSMLSNEGNREYNEDYVVYCICKEKACFVLADGLGGHGKGEIASKYVCESVIEDFEKNGDVFILEKAIQNAQKRLLQLQKEMNYNVGMKTTIVILYINGDNAQWAHIGDSRLYLWNRWRIVERTFDHSVPQMLVLARELKEKEIRFHEDRNRLLRAMGNENDNLKADISKVTKCKKGQSFLLCSDGFWEYIDEKKMQTQYLVAKTPEEWLRRMERIVCKNGKDSNMDNYSAIAVWL